MTPAPAPPPSRLERAYNWVVRRRSWIGGLAFALWGVAQTDPWLAAHPRLNTYGGIIVTYVFAAGKHRSDREQREEQGRLGLLPENRGRVFLP